METILVIKTGSGSWYPWDGYDYGNRASAKRSRSGTDRADWPLAPARFAQTDASFPGKAPVRRFKPRAR